MNAAHIHLVLNHIPIIAIPVALLFLVQSIWTKNFAARKFAYLVLVLASASAALVYWTGEPAEELVEHLPGVSEALIESHEEAAGVSLALTALAGGTALFGLFAGSTGRKQELSKNAVIVTSVVALGSLVYTANLGGKIRHTELRDEPSATDSKAPEPTEGAD